MPNNNYIFSGVDRIVHQIKGYKGVHINIHSHTNRQFEIAASLKI